MARGLAHKSSSGVRGSRAQFFNGSRSELFSTGLGLIEFHSQKMMVAARAVADGKTWTPVIIVRHVPPALSPAEQDFDPVKAFSELDGLRSLFLPGHAYAYPLAWERFCEPISDTAVLVKPAINVWQAAQKCPR